MDFSFSFTPIACCIQNAYNSIGYMRGMVRLRSSSMPSKCTTFQLNFSNTHSLCITDSVSTGTNSFTVSFTVKKSSGNGKNLINITTNNTSYNYKSFKCNTATLGMCHPTPVGYIYITSATD